MEPQAGGHAPPARRKADVMFKRAGDGSQGYWFGPISNTKPLSDLSAKIAKRLGFPEGTEVRLVNVRAGGREVEVWDDHDLDALRNRALANPAALTEVNVYPAAGPSHTQTAAFRTPGPSHPATGRGDVSSSPSFPRSPLGTQSSPASPVIPPQRNRVSKGKTPKVDHPQASRQLSSATVDNGSLALQGQPDNVPRKKVKEKKGEKREKLQADSSIHGDEPVGLTGVADQDPSTPGKQPNQKKAGPARRETSPNHVAPASGSITNKPGIGKRKRSISPNPRTSEDAGPIDSPSGPSNHTTETSPGSARKRKKRAKMNPLPKHSPLKGTSDDASEGLEIAAGDATRLSEAHPVAKLKQTYKPAKPSPLGRSSTSAPDEVQRDLASATKAPQIASTQPPDARLDGEAPRPPPSTVNLAALPETPPEAPTAVPKLAMAQKARSSAKKLRTSTAPSVDTTAELPPDDSGPSKQSLPPQAETPAEVPTALATETTLPVATPNLMMIPDASARNQPKSSTPGESHPQPRPTTKRKRETSSVLEWPTKIADDPPEPPVDADGNEVPAKPSKPKSAARPRSSSGAAGTSTTSMSSLLARYRAKAAAEAAASAPGQGLRTTADPATPSIAGPNESEQSSQTATAETSSSEPVTSRASAEGANKRGIAASNGKATAGAVAETGTADENSSATAQTADVSVPSAPKKKAAGSSRTKKPVPAPASAADAADILNPTADSETYNLQADTAAAAIAPDPAAKARTASTAAKKTAKKTAKPASLSAEAAPRILDSTPSGVGSAATVPASASAEPSAPGPGPDPVASVVSPDDNPPPRKAINKRRSASNLPESKVPCIVCGRHTSPMHMQLDCPTVLGGVTALEERLVEVKALRKSRDKALAVEAIEGWIKRLRDIEEKKRVLRAVQGLPPEPEVLIDPKSSDTAMSPTTVQDAAVSATESGPEEPRDGAGGASPPIVERAPPGGDGAEDDRPEPATPPTEEPEPSRTPIRSLPRTPITYSRSRPTPRRQSTSSISSSSSSESSSTSDADSESDSESNSDTSITSASAEIPKKESTDTSLPAIFLRGLKTRRRPGSISAVSASTALIETETSDSGSASGSKSESALGSESTSTSHDSRDQSPRHSDSASTSASRDSAKDGDGPADEGISSDGEKNEDATSETTSKVIGRLASGADLRRTTMAHAAGLASKVPLSVDPQQSTVAPKRAGRASNPPTAPVPLHSNSDSDSSDSSSESDDDSTPPNIPSPSMYTAALPFAGEETLPDPEALFQQYFSRPLSQLEQAEVAASALNMGNVSLRPALEDDDDAASDDSDAVHSSSDIPAVVARRGGVAAGDDASSIGDFGSATEDQDSEAGQDKDEPAVPVQPGRLQSFAPNANEVDDIASDTTSIPRSGRLVRDSLESADSANADDTPGGSPLDPIYAVGKANGAMAGTGPSAPLENEEAESQATSQRPRRGKPSASAGPGSQSRQKSGRQSARFRGLDYQGDSEAVGEFEGSVALARARAEEATPEPFRISQQELGESAIDSDNDSPLVQVGQLPSSNLKTKAKGDNLVERRYGMSNGPVGEAESTPAASQSIRRSGRLRSAEVEVVIPMRRASTSQRSQDSSQASQPTPKAQLQVLVEESDELPPPTRTPRPQRSSQVDELLSTPPEVPASAPILSAAPATPQRRSSRVSASPGVSPAVSRRRARKGESGSVEPPSPAQSTLSTRSIRRKAENSGPRSPLFMPQSQPPETQAYSTHRQHQNETLGSSSPAVPKSRRGRKALGSPIPEEDESIPQDQATPKAAKKQNGRASHIPGHLSSPSSRSSSPPPLPNGEASRQSDVGEGGQAKVAGGYNNPGLVVDASAESGKDADSDGNGREKRHGSQGADTDADAPDDDDDASPSNEAEDTIEQPEEPDDIEDDASSLFPFPTLLHHNPRPAASSQSRPDPVPTSFAPSLSSLPMDLLRSGVSAFANFAGLSASQPLPSRSGASSGKGTGMANGRSTSLISFSQDPKSGGRLANGKKGQVDDLASESDSETGSESSSDDDDGDDGRPMGGRGAASGKASLKGRYASASSSSANKRKATRTKGKPIGW